MWQENMIRNYFEAWIDNDISVLRSIFANDIIYTECYGPEYHGIDQLERWFYDWNKVGTVLEWSISGFIHQNDTTAVQWYFRCDYNGVVDGFDGVSIITFNADQKITRLKEFQSKAEHCFPYEK